MEKHKVVNYLIDNRDKTVLVMSGTANTANLDKILIYNGLKQAKLRPKLTSNDTIKLASGGKVIFRVPDAALHGIKADIVLIDGEFQNETTN